MSKRAEEAAYNYAKENGTLGYDYNQIYDAAKNGYEQAEKDTIERACDMLMNYVFEEVTPEMRDHFRKRLEEE